MRRLKATKLGASILALWMGASASALAESVIRAPEDFRPTALGRGDDQDVGAKASLGFRIDFYGIDFDALYVNNNGNVTFDERLSEYLPFDLNSTERQILAPFFADVDTHNPESGIVAYGPATVEGRKAFLVNWPGVGYYKQRAERTNDFQLAIIDRSDVAEGDFDFEFNYVRVQWETGSDPKSGGVNGLGGKSARVGFSNGSKEPETFFELPGSGQPGSFLDGGHPLSLIRSSNVGVPGRWVFNVRSGSIFETTPQIEELTRPKTRTFR